MSSLISFSSCDFLKYFPSTLTRISLEFALLGSAAGLAMESGDVGCAWLAASLFFSSLLPQPNMTTTTNITYTAIHFFLFSILIKFLPIIIVDDFSITKPYMQNAYIRQEDNPDPLIPILNQSAIFVGSVVAFLNVYNIRLVASSLPPQYHLLFINVIYF